VSAVLVRHWAAARAAAGTAEEHVLDVMTLGELTVRLAQEHGPAYATVLARCSFLVDEVSPGTRDHAEVPLADGAVVDVLPPFAGGSTGTRHPRDPAPVGASRAGSPRPARITPGTASGRDGLGCP
jgi:molybdopterin converting factor small subunit